MQPELVAVNQLGVCYDIQGGSKMWHTFLSLSFI